MGTADDLFDVDYDDEHHHLIDAILAADVDNVHKHCHVSFHFPFSVDEHWTFHHDHRPDGPDVTRRGDRIHPPGVTRLSADDWPWSE